MRAITLLLLATLCGYAEQLPKLTATTLSGETITLPGNLKVKAYVLAFGFSHKSDKAFAAWDKLIAPVYARDPRVAYYEIPVLEGVPGFVKGMILHGMRKTIPKPEQSRFAPTYQGEAPLKKIVGYSQPEAGYLVVAAPDGTVVWTSHAPASELELRALQKAVSELELR